MTRWSRDRRVVIVEEPLEEADEPAWRFSHDQRENLLVATPLLPCGTPAVRRRSQLRALMSRLIAEHVPDGYILWYYTPLSLDWTRHLRPAVTVYDCMDELSAFAGAAPALVPLERELLGRADLVFTGGQSLYEAKRGAHPRVYAFPSSVDTAHFRRARHHGADPADQAAIPHPRLGFFGVIDERMDLELLAGIADARPTWTLLLLGPVVKIDPRSLPRRPNIHYLGPKRYDELPAYLGGWDVALLTFAQNAATRFISPTKTPEYLAGGKPVVSTPLRDVVRPYGEEGLVEIADGVPAFIASVTRSLARQDESSWLRRVDERLAQMSWETTWTAMRRLVEKELESGSGPERQARRRKPVYASEG